MALADRVRKIPTAGMPCSVGVLLKVMTPEESQALTDILGTDEKWGWPASEIYTALKEEGYEVGRQTINRHRGKKCRCWV